MRCGCFRIEGREFDADESCTLPSVCEMSDTRTDSQETANADAHCRFAFHQVDPACSGDLQCRVGSRAQPRSCSRRKPRPLIGPCGSGHRQQRVGRDEAIAEADTLLLTVPNTLGVEYNAHVIESTLTQVAPALG